MACGRSYIFSSMPVFDFLFSFFFYSKMHISNKMNINELYKTSLLSIKAPNLKVLDESKNSLNIDFKLSFDRMCIKIKDKRNAL